MSHPNAKVVEHKFGLGVVATGPIKKDELIASFDGEIYYGETNDDFPEEILNYPITFGPDRARNSKGIANKLNHACSPNCGIHGDFDIVAMRDIKEGEELCWDYDMSEDHDWSMECGCGSPECRKLIHGFRHLSHAKKAEYKGYISNLIVKAHGLES